MKKILFVLSMALASVWPAQAKLNVVATLADYGSLAREIVRNSNSQQPFLSMYQ